MRRLLIYIFSTLFLSVVVVPPVYITLHRNHNTPPEDPVNRLIVDFFSVNQSVKSLVSPILWDFFEETFLETSAIKIITFKDNQALNEVRKSLEGTAANILRDQTLFTPAAIESSTTITTSPGNFEHQQWYLSMISAQRAWNSTRGSKTIIVAVVDTGCDLTHPDLKENLWVNTKEIPGNNIDDDGNGYIDDVHGYDFAGDCRSDWQSARCGSKSAPQDTHSHGTHCAGIIAAANNGFGITGIAPNVRIMCLKVTDATGTFYMSHILKAYDYAARMGAHIISCSFGPSEPNTSPSTLQRASMTNETAFYRKAIASLRNILVIAAAGNENTDLNQLVQVNATYNPCTSNTSNLLCVLASTPQDTRWSETLDNNVPVGTNYGSLLVDIAAPGREILSTVPGGGYANKTGSSMATPLTAGVAALVMSILGSVSSPQSPTANETRKILLETLDINPITYQSVKYKGRINAAKAVAAAVSQTSNYLLIFPTTTTSRSLAFMEGFSELTPSGESVRYSNSMRFDINPKSPFILQSFFSPPSPGIFTIRAIASNSVKITIGSRTIITADKSTTVPKYPTDYKLFIRDYPALFDFQMEIPANTTVDITFAFPSDPQKFIYPINNMVIPIDPLTPMDSFHDSLPKSSVYQTVFKIQQEPKEKITGSSANSSGWDFTSYIEDLTNITHADVISNISNIQLPVIGIIYAPFLPPFRRISIISTCALCSLRINDVLAIDINKLTTKRSGCITFVSTPPNTVYNISIHIFIDTSMMTMPFSVTYMPCDAQTTLYSLTPFIRNVALWSPNPSPTQSPRPFISGVQCDVWPSSVKINTDPYLKFRLEAPKFPTFNFFIRNVYSSFPISAAALQGQLFQNIHLRCWAYMNRTFTNGIVATRTSSVSLRIYFGNQLVYTTETQSSSSSSGPPYPPKSSPSMSQYYYLMVFEAINVPAITIFGITEGINKLPLPIDNMILPLPITTLSSTLPPPVVTVMQLTMYRPDPSAYYETQPGLSSIVVFNLQPSPTIAANASAKLVTPNTLLTFGFPKSQVSYPFVYLRGEGVFPFPVNTSSKIHSPHQTVMLRIHDANAFSLTIGTITIITGTENPSQIFNMSSSLINGKSYTLIIRHNMTRTNIIKIDFSWF